MQGIASKRLVAALLAMGSLFWDAAPAAAQECSAVNALLPDADGDGIADAFELYGCADAAGLLDFPGMGAHPLKKDVLVESDVMIGVTVESAALQDVIDAFAAAPVPNPDGTTGINLHIDASGTVPFATQTLFSDSLSIDDSFVAPRVGASPGGLIAVAWQDDRDGNGHYDVRVRRFDAAAAATTREILVNRDTRGHQRRPDLALNDAGHLVVVWEDDRDGNGIYQIFARMFDRAGNPLSRDVAVNPAAAGQHVRPSVGIDAAGNWVAVWEDDRDGNGYHDIFARRFDRTGRALGDEVRVNQVGDGQQTGARIAMTADGRSVVVWEDDADGNGYYQIMARHLDSEGVPAGDAFTVNQVSDGQQRKPAVALSASGSIVVVWEDDQDGNGYYEILGRLFDAGGAARGKQFVVNAISDGQQRRPSVAMSGSGWFAAAWEDDRDGDGSYEILTRMFEADGAARTGNMPLSATAATGRQVSASLAMADAQIAFAWQDDRRGGGDWSILLRLLSPDGTGATADVTVHDRVVTFGSLKAGHFTDTRRGFFRYGVIANEDVHGAGGWGMVPGVDFIVNQRLDPTRLVLSSVFMHELGHNLGLHHGGDEPKNDKPNYLSVMNYRYGLNGVDGDCDARGDGLLAFSNGRTIHLDENSLDERIGICNGERTVNAIDRGQQRRPAIGVAGSGRFVVVWDDDRAGGRAGAVYARLFDAAGEPMAPVDTLVSRVEHGQQKGIAVGVAGDGGFIVVWQDNRDGYDVSRIRARRFAPDGTPQPGDIVTVNGMSDGHQRNADVAVAPDGAFVVVWEEDREGEGSSRIFARLFGADGAPLTDAVQVSAAGNGRQRAPRVAIAPDRRFAVVWEDDRRRYGHYQVFAQRFTAAGTADGSELGVNPMSSGPQRHPDVGMDAAGRFVVVWEDDQEASGLSQIVGRRFDARDESFGALFTVNQVSAGQHRLPRVHANAAFEFVVTWQDDRDRDGSYDIFARPYRSDGSPRADETPVNLTRSGQRRAPDVGVDASGRFYTVWEDDRNESGHYQIVAVRSSAEGAHRDPVAIDWDRDENISETAVSTNVVGPDSDYRAVLRDHDDWSNLRLARGLPGARPSRPSTNYTADQMAQLRRLVPGGASLAAGDIEEKMRQATPFARKPMLVPPNPPPALASQQAIEDDAAQSSAAEPSTLRLEIRADGRPAAPGRHAFRGELVEVGPQFLMLRENGTGRAITLDLSSTPGLQLSPVNPDGSLTGAWGVKPALSGDVAGVALRDARGLFLAAESRRSTRMLSDADLAPFSLRQDRDDVGDPGRSSACYRIYHPDVVVSAGTHESVVIPHGQRKIVRVGSTAYLVTIVRSDHTEALPCGIALEKAPWELEYLLRRLDDPDEMLSLEQALSVDETPDAQEAKDAPDPGRKDDGPPTAALQADAPPPATPLRDSAGDRREDELE